MKNGKKPVCPNCGEVHEGSELAAAARNITLQLASKYSPADSLFIIATVAAALVSCAPGSPLPIRRAVFIEAVNSMIDSGIKDANP